MTKLQTIEAEIQALSPDEQRVLISKFIHAITPKEDDIFVFTDEQSAELDRRLANLKGTRSIEEVFSAL